MTFLLYNMNPSSLLLADALSFISQYQIAHRIDADHPQVQPHKRFPTEVAIFAHFIFRLLCYHKQRYKW